MTADIDMDGGTYTIVADSEETCRKMKDDSSGHDGTLVMEAGSTLNFDNVSGSGFDADWVGTIQVDGDADALCTIKSVDTNPQNPFAMTLGCTGYIYRCRIAGNAAYSCTHATVVDLEEVYWGYATYCSVDDVRRITGIRSNLMADADISELIAQAVDEINDYTGRQFYTGTATNEEHDYAGGGTLQTRFYPIASITKLEYRSGDSWTEKTHGADDDYYASPADLRRGIIRLLEDPVEDYDAIRVTYTYGETQTAGRIKKLCAMTAGREALWGVQSPQKAGVLDGRIAALDTEIKRLRGQIGGKLRVYNGKLKTAESRYPRRTRGYPRRYY